MAQALGITAFVCGAVVGVGWIMPSLPFTVGWLAVLSGIAAIVVGIIALVKHQARKQAVIGIVLVVLTGPVAFGLAFVTTMVILMVSYPD